MQRTKNNQAAVNVQEKNARESDCVRAYGTAIQERRNCGIVAESVQQKVTDKASPILSLKLF